MFLADCIFSKRESSQKFVVKVKTLLLQYGCGSNVEDGVCFYWSRQQFSGKFGPGSKELFGYFSLIWWLNGYNSYVGIFFQKLLLQKFVILFLQYVCCSLYVKNCWNSSYSGSFFFPRIVKSWEFWIFPGTRNFKNPWKFLDLFPIIR